MTSHRPFSIQELTARSLPTGYDPSKSLKDLLRIATAERDAGEQAKAANDVDNAFIHFAKASTLMLKDLPTHPKFAECTASQKEAVTVQGRMILDSLGAIKLLVSERFSDWRACHPDADPSATPTLVVVQFPPPDSISQTQPFTDYFQPSDYAHGYSGPKHTGGSTRAHSFHPPNPPPLQRPPRVLYPLPPSVDHHQIRPSLQTELSQTMSAPIWTDGLVKRNESGVMPIPDVVAQLVESQCPDITDRLDLPECGNAPVEGRGYGDTYRGAFLGGELVAIKCARLCIRRDNGDVKKILKEAITGKIPFHGKGDMAVVVAVCSMRETPGHPKEFPSFDLNEAEILWNTILGCWAYDSSNRPESHVVQAQLEVVKRGVVQPPLRSAIPTIPRRKLSDSLYEAGLSVFIAKSDYKGLSWGDNKPLEVRESMEMNSVLDARRIADLARGSCSRLNFHSALDGDLTKKTLTKRLTRFRSGHEPKFIYISGHATSDGQDFTFLPIDCVNDAGNSSQGIKSNELGRLLVDLASPLPVNMTLVTDFCYAFNFLSLPYVLRRNSDGSYFWDDSAEFSSHAWSPEHKILHFTSGATGASTTIFEGTGSLFTREFYNAGVDTDLSLSQRMDTIQKGVDQSLGEYNRKRKLNLQQEIQLYSSHKFDLNNPTSFTDLLACRNTLSPAPPDRPDTRTLVQ
ncbi:hypothetical protein FRC09_003262 [Ceratobasidium sp. 395]|nr:hypothetical protein FRC09_003262 [Ceratobasidium sp. 395]